MSGKSFPLSLDSLGKKGGAKAAPGPAKAVATPQTATQNAAQNVLLRQQSQAHQASQVASPSRLHRHAQELAASAPGPDSGRASPLVSDAVRHAMVARVAKQGVKDALVLEAMAAVPRHLFMEPGLAGQAYIDASIPIGHQQTISQPYIVARMIEAMRNGGQLNRVLEIGTGCGYQAAVLSRLAQEVYSIERIKPLHELAKNNLRPMRIANIRLHYGDGMLGLPQVAPFDGIILAAAGMEVPRALLEQMSVGGRLLAPVGGREQVLQLVVRTGKAEWSSSTLETCHFVPLCAGTV